MLVWSEKVDGRLEDWDEHLKVVGLKVSQKNTEHLPPKNCTSKIKMKMYDQEDYTDMQRTSKFTYLGAMIDQERRCEVEVTTRISVAVDR